MRKILTPRLVWISFLVAVVLGPLIASGRSAQARASPPFCSAADVRWPQPQTGGSAPAGGLDSPNSIARYVAGLRDQLRVASVEYIEAAGRLLRSPVEKTNLGSGLAAEHVAQLRGELRELVIRGLASTTGAEVELAVRGASIDVLLARIKAYELVYGLRGEATTAFNVLSQADLEQADAVLRKAQESLAFDRAKV